MLALPSRRFLTGITMRLRATIQKVARSGYGQTPVPAEVADEIRRIVELRGYQRGNKYSICQKPRVCDSSDRRKECCAAGGVERPVQYMNEMVEPVSSSDQMTSRYHGRTWLDLCAISTPPGERYKAVEAMHMIRKSAGEVGPNGSACSGTEAVRYERNCSRW